MRPSCRSHSQCYRSHCCRSAWLRRGLLGGPRPPEHCQHPQRSRGRAPYSAPAQPSVYCPSWPVRSRRPGSTGPGLPLPEPLGRPAQKAGVDRDAHHPSASLRRTAPDGAARAHLKAAAAGPAGGPEAGCGVSASAAADMPAKRRAPSALVTRRAMPRGRLHLLPSQKPLPAGGVESWQLQGSRCSSRHGVVEPPRPRLLGSPRRPECAAGEWTWFRRLADAAGPPGATALSAPAWQRWRCLYHTQPCSPTRRPTTDGAVPAQG